MVSMAVQAMPNSILFPLPIMRAPFNVHPALGHHPALLTFPKNSNEATVAGYLPVIE
jgi:hypothetical protein